jgi:mono/diheme cytochrome c family protein
MKVSPNSHTAIRIAGGCLCAFVASWILNLSQAAPPWRLGGRWTSWGFLGRDDRQGANALGGTWYNFPPSGNQDESIRGDGWGNACGKPPDVGGSWFWMRSPEQERVVVASLYNRYCIRCHGVDGRGVWDIPGIPNFTNHRWQLSRSDDQIARIIIEGRGAVMPTFRGTLTLEEAWAMARYLRTFEPGTESTRPGAGEPSNLGKEQELLPPRKMK